MKENKPNLQVEVEYLAFISYRHADNTEEDRQWATWLHQQLEIYDIPSDLIGTTNLRGEIIPERIYPVFRDEVSLPADADLSKAITQALDRSRFLIVLCSPRAVQSRYVNEEILHFKRTGKADRIMAALVLGEPNASIDEAKLEDPEDARTLECFPKALQFHVNAEGELDETQQTEPIAANLRLPDGRKGLTNPQVYKQHLLEQGRSKVAAERLADAYEEQLNTAKLKVIAGILGVRMEQLIARDKIHQLNKAREQSRRARRVAAVMLILALVATVGSGVAFMQWKKAENEKIRADTTKNAALVSQSNYLKSLSKNAIVDGNHDTALLLALEALPGPYGGDRPYVDGFWDIVVDANNLNRKKLYVEGSKAAHRGGHRQFFAANHNQITLHSKDDASALSVIELPNQASIESLASSPDGNFLAAATHDTVFIWNVESRELLLSNIIVLDRYQTILGLQFSEDSSKMLLYKSTSSDGWMGNSVVSVWDINTLEVIKYSVRQMILSVRFCEKNVLIVSENMTIYGVRTYTVFGATRGARMSEVRDPERQGLYFDGKCKNYVAGPDENGESVFYKAGKGYRFSVGNRSSSNTVTGITFQESGDSFLVKSKIQSQEFRFTGDTLESDPPIDTRLVNKAYVSSEDSLKIENNQVALLENNLGDVELDIDGKELQGKHGYLNYTVVDTKGERWALFSERMILVYNLGTRELISSQESSCHLASVIFSKRKGELISLCRNGIITIVDYSKDEIRSEFETDIDQSYVPSIKGITPGGELVVKTGVFVKLISLKNGGERSVSILNEPIKSLVYSQARGGIFVGVGALSNKLLIVDYDLQKIIFEITDPILASRTHVSEISIDPTGRWLSLVFPDSASVYALEPAGAKLVLKISAYIDYIRFNQAGTFMAVVYDSEQSESLEQEIGMWDLSDPQQELFRIKKDYIGDILFQGDYALMLTDPAQLIDARSGDVVQKFYSRGAKNAYIIDDARFLFWSTFSNNFVMIRSPVLEGRDIVDYSARALPIGRECLSAEERELFYLPKSVSTEAKTAKCRLK